MNRNSRHATEELDAFISARMAGQEVQYPAGVREADAHLAAELVALASSTHPDYLYVDGLAARLTGVSAHGTTTRVPAFVAPGPGAEVVPSEQALALPPGMKERTGRSIRALGSIQQAPSRSGRLGHRVGIAAAALLVLLAVAMFPAARALAQQIAQFFWQAAQPVMSVVFVTPEGGEIHGPENIPPFIRVSEAEALAGFDVKEPTMALPEGFVFSGAGYLPAREIGGVSYPPSVGLAYDFCDSEGCRPRGYEPLYITAYPWADDPSSLPEELLGIHGPVHGVESVELRGVTGEYVSGWWDGIPLMPKFEDGVFLMPTGEVDATWNPDLPFQVVRWQENGFVFEVMNREDAPGSPAFLERDVLFALAESLD